jgi:hypothetical protein
VLGKGLAGLKGSIGGFMERSNRLLLLAVAFAFVFHSALTLTGAYRWSYDAYTHMFFADHYVRSWFGLWEPRWFGGFYVTTYPPLVHQCLALLSLVLGLEAAYQVLSLMLMVLIPIAVYHFARVFVSGESAGYASLLSVFLPSIGQAAYYAGQLTTLFGLVSSLFASVCLYRFLSGGRAVDFALVLSLLGVSVSSHHLSALFLLPLCLLLSLVMVIWKPPKEVGWKKIVFRLVLITVVGGLVCLLVVYPFWVFLLGAEMQAPIPHGSREVFSNPGWADVYFWNMYGVSLIFVPLACVFVVKNRRLVPLFLAGLFMFVMGLGGTTALPLVLGEWWKWLTYDRFAVWAEVTLLPISGWICKVVSDRLPKFKLGRLLLAGLLVSLAVNTWWVSGSALYFGHPSEVRVEEVKAFLDQDGRWRWRYLTLGFGEAQLARLSMTVNATTLDGVYYTGRLLPILRESGVGIIDASKYYSEIMGEPGLTLLSKVLSDASSYSLRWVFCSDPFYEPILVAHNFVRLGTLSDGITTVWHREGVPMLPSNAFERSEISASGLMWGTSPMISLLSTVFLLFYKRRRETMTISTLVR